MKIKTPQHERDRQRQAAITCHGILMDKPDILILFGEPATEAMDTAICTFPYTGKLIYAEDPSPSFGDRGKESILNARDRLLDLMP